MSITQITIDTGRKAGTISPYLYGHFAEQIGGVIYDGIWVGKDSPIPNIRGFRKDLVEKLKAISPPVIRWPGGCFAESYDWRDGIGAQRPTRPSWWTHLDGRYETNEFGTHEFMDFCALVGAKPYLAVNATSLTPMDARNWVDYCVCPAGTTALAARREENGAREPFDVPFWGIGNENWGGGGTMTAQQYAWEYRKCATMVRNVVPKAKLIAGGANAHSIRWAEIFLENMKEIYGTPVPLDGISFHYYFSETEDVEFSEEGWNRLIGNAKKLEDHIAALIELLGKYGRSEKVKLYLDEWGSMYAKGVAAKEKNQLFRQQVTQRDAVVSALTLHILHRYCGNVHMANIAQLVNCLSALFLTDGEKCVETPVYHVFDMYCGHQGAEAVPVDNGDSEVSVSASVKDGNLLITMVNLSYREDKQIKLTLDAAGSVFVRMLCAEDLRDHNDFDTPCKVCPVETRWDINDPVTLPKGAVAAISVTRQ